MTARLVLVVAVLALGIAPAADARKRPRLKAFASCKALVNYGERFADRGNAPRGTPVGPAQPVARDQATGGEQPAAAPGPAEGDAARDYSGTNVQEAGVAEPDIVKTDGDVVYVVSGQVLYAIAARGTPALLGSLELKGGYGHQLLRRDDRLLVTYQAAPDGAGPEPGHGGGDVASSPAFAPYEPKTVLAEVDISDPAKMAVRSTLTTDGTLYAARKIGRHARVVIGSHPQAMPATTARASGAKRKARRAWLPKALLRNARTGKRRRRALVSCRRVRHTTTYSGLGMLTVLTLDLEDGLEVVDSDALMSDAQTVYASQGALYVATQRWWDGSDGSAPPSTRTAIHKFATSGGETAYRASGEVPGFLLSQWALSEHEGVLRVASTDLPTWWGTDPGSESFVITLDEREGRLAELGRVGGLGKGERIFGVRFIEDTGYVVTFRQTDPLYTVDVSDPAEPAVLGELKILGYSAYLHPVGDGLLLGVGQDATEEGVRTGAQVSLFDVRDPANPARLHQYVVEGGSSTDVEWDHHAFLYWAPEKLAVLPTQIWPPHDPEQPYEWQPPWTGAIALDAGGAGIAERGRVTHPAPEQSYWRARVTRSLVVGQRLFTVSGAGVKASDLGSLGDVAWVPFPG